MRKRLTAALLCLILAFTLFPVTAFVDGNTVYVGGVALTSTDGATVYATTDASGNVTTDGADETNYNIKWDGSTLTLNDTTITGVYSENTQHNTVGIYASSSSGDVSLKIELQGENTIASNGNGIYVYSPDGGGTASLTITGSGSLNASGSSNGISVQSNSSDAALTIQDAEVKATVASSSGFGVNMRFESNSSSSLTVDGGSLTVSGFTGILYDSIGSDSAPVKVDLTISDSALVDARDGGIGAGSITNLQSVNPDDSSTGIVFDGSQGTVYGNVILQEDLTIGEAESLTIPDGASLTIPNNITLTNQGTVTTTETGTLTNNGIINNSGTLPDNIGGTAPPSITTTSLAGGTVGTAYSATLAAAGSPISWTWSAATGSNTPPGLTLNSDGTITGNPTAAGTYSFTVTAANIGGSDSEQLSITINPAAISITATRRAWR